MGTSWWVDGEDLKDRPRMGGVHAIKGFDFQKAYALLRLTWLPTHQRGLVELRYEGAQDIDLRFGDSKQIFVQAKDYQVGGVTLSVLHDVLAGFARDVISAKARDCRDEELPHFQLVSTSGPVESKAFELLRGVFQPEHAADIVALIKTEYRKGFDDSQVHAFVLKALERTKYEIVFGDEVLADLNAQASWNLARFGVPVEQVSTILAKLEKVLVPRASFQIGDVVELLEGLPEGHPGRENSPCRVLPSRRNLELTPTIKMQFMHGAAQSLWRAVASGIDVKREEQDSIIHNLDEISSHGGMLVVQGSAGTGKSTLIRRIAWNAHLSGSHIVLDVLYPGEVREASWSAILNLVKQSEKPLLLVVDDIWRHKTFVDGLDRHVRRNLCVLATTRPGENLGFDLRKLVVHKVGLGKLSSNVVNGLRALVQGFGGPPTKISDSVTHRFAESGQLLALSLSLQSGSLKDFAKSILGPLGEKPEMLSAFLDLCVVGRYDQTAPMSLFESSGSVESRFWLDDSFDGLSSIQVSKTSKRLRVGHALVAQAIVDVAEVDIIARIIDVCCKCDPAVAEERKFAIRLLISAANDESLKPATQSTVKMLTEAIEGLLKQASFADIHRLAVVLKSIGQYEQASEVVKAATGDRIKDAADVSLALSRRSNVEFAALYPAILKFFEKDADAFGRRRFIQTVGQMGTPPQQLEVAAQTANWLTRHGFPSEETRALFYLGVHAIEKEVARKLLSVVKFYFEFGDVTIESATAAVLLARRAKEDDALRVFGPQVLIILERVDTSNMEERQLARQLARVRDALNDTQRLSLAKILIKMHLQTKRFREKLWLLRSAIHVTPSDNVEGLRDAVTTMKQRYNKAETTGLEIQLNLRFPA